MAQVQSPPPWRSQKKKKEKKQHWTVCTFHPYYGLGKIWPVGQIPPTVFVKKKFLLEHSLPNSIHLHVFVLQQQNIEAARCPTAKPKIFPVWPFTEKSLPIPFPLIMTLYSYIKIMSLPISFCPGSLSSMFISCSSCISFLFLPCI